jgi:hypothetical protein
LHSEEFVVDTENPGLRWTWILPNYAHGVLIEATNDYQLAEGLLAGD